MSINKKVLAGAGLAALICVGGTFAYFNESLSLDNPLDTGTYDNMLIEKYNPPMDDLRPGETWDKDVAAENVGTYPVLVRVKMQEDWTRKQDDGSSGGTIYKSLLSGDSKFMMASPSNADGAYLAVQPDDPDKTVKDPITGETVPGDRDGLTPEADETVIYKALILEGDSDPNGNASHWFDGGDGYWYWNGVLEGNGSEASADAKSATSLLLDELTVAANIDLGYYVTDEYYALGTEFPSATESNWKKVDWTQEKDENGDGVKDISDIAEKENVGEATDANGKLLKLYRKSESRLDEEKKGYSDSIYTLTITSEFVQATSEAVKATWNVDDAFIAEKMTRITTDPENPGNYINAE